MLQKSEEGNARVTSKIQEALMDFSYHEKIGEGFVATYLISRIQHHNKAQKSKANLDESNSNRNLNSRYHISFDQLIECSRTSVRDEFTLKIYQFIWMLKERVYVSHAISKSSTNPTSTSKQRNQIDLFEDTPRDSEEDWTSNGRSTLGFTFKGYPNHHCKGK
jgi:hypothetical protein